MGVAPGVVVEDTAGNAVLKHSVACIVAVPRRARGRYAMGGKTGKAPWPNSLAVGCLTGDGKLGRPGGRRPLG